MDPDRFEALVADALDSLPEDFLQHLENIEVIVEEWPSEEELSEAGLSPGQRRQLLGLYVGVPLTERGEWYAGVLPDRIVLYQGSIEAAAGASEEAIKDEVRFTVVHEVAHYYGISDERLQELGWG